LAQQGAEIYRSLGCAACHSQQVRGFGGDRERGFGPRISVAQDSLHDYPVQLGNVRVGPDLANYGSQHTNDAAILLHLYAPQKAMPGSIMPPYRFLFETHDAETNVVTKDGSFFLADEKKLVVPKPEALKLSAYMRSLKTDLALYEAPILKTTKPVASPAPAATNAPAK
jgi:cytochrome c oxidase cbb3-type subunit II